MMLKRKTTRVGEEKGDCECSVMNIPLQDVAPLTISPSIRQDWTSASPPQAEKKPKYL